MCHAVENLLTNENQSIIRRIIQASLLKITCKIVDSIKSYGKINLKLLTVSLWKNFSWGLTYFDEFIYIYIQLVVQHG